MSSLTTGAARISFDGRHLHAGAGPGRRFEIDARCLTGQRLPGLTAHVCAVAGDETAALAFDQPEVQQVRRDALAWWIPLLGDALVCLSTLALDETRYGGAITVTRRMVDWRDDPFARIFPGTVVRSDLFAAVAPPPGPVLERYAGVPWPGGRFIAPRRPMASAGCRRRESRRPV